MMLNLINIVFTRHVEVGLVTASTNLKDFSRNSRKFQKSPKCEKAHVCKETACALNFVKFYKIFFQNKIEILFKNNLINLMII